MPRIKAEIRGVCPRMSDRKHEPPLKGAVCLRAGENGVAGKTSDFVIAVVARLTLFSAALEALSILSLATSAFHAHA